MTVKGRAASTKTKFSGDFDDVNLSGDTGGDGSAVIDSVTTFKGKVGSLTFCVDTVVSNSSLTDSIEVVCDTL